MSDYRRLRNEAGLVSDYSGLIWVDGPDAVSFLDGLLSQNVAAMEPGQVARSLLLAPNGKLRAQLWLLRDESRVGLVTDAQRVDAVVADLSRFKIRVDAEIRSESDTVSEVWGPAAAAMLPDPPSPGRWAMTVGRLQAALAFRHSPLPRFLVVGDSIGIPVVGPEAAEAVRIEVGEPVVGVDVDDGTIPQEMGDIASAVDFAKGCYLGQELVARIDSRGHVNRLLVGIVFDTAHVPLAGSAVQSADTQVGTLSSAVKSPARGVAVGIATVRKEVVAGSTVMVAGRSGRISALPIVA